MRWSAIVKRYEPFLAPVLTGRLRLHATHYRGAHDDEGRGWITLDGRQIASFESLPHLMRVYDLQTELQALGEDNTARETATKIARREGLIPLWHFQNAVVGYPDFSIAEALASDDGVIRALAMFDRRLGKRRLAAMELPVDELKLVRSFYRLRCEAEGMRAAPQA